MQITAFCFKRLLIYPVILIILLVLGFTVTAEKQPAWFQQAQDEAEQDGYKLITAHEMKALYESGENFTIIDVRPEYEFREGHILHANSLEFDLGDKLELKSDKQAALIGLLGSDKKQTIIFYCRSVA